MVATLDSRKTPAPRDTGRAAPQRAEGAATDAAGSATVDDLGLALGASPEQLAQLDAAVTRVRAAISGATGAAGAQGAAPASIDTTEQAKIDKMTLQEVDYYLEGVAKELLTAPDDAAVKARETYAKAHRSKVNGEFHGAATTRTDETKKHLAAQGAAASAGISRESGRADHHAIGRELGPADGEKQEIRKVTAEGIKNTTSLTRATTENASQVSSRTSGEQTANDKDGTKTTLRVEDIKAARAGQTTTSSATTHETNSLDTEKNATRTSVVDDKKATITERKSEVSSLDEARKAKEKKDKEEREKLRSLDPAVNDKLGKLAEETRTKLAAATSDEQRAKIQKDADAARSKLVTKDSTVAKSVKLASTEKVLGSVGGDRKGKLKAEGALGSVTAEGEVATAEAKVGGDVGWDPTKGLTVTGTAGAKAVLVGGSAKYETPAIDFNIGGEAFQATFSVGVSASTLAEAQGSVAINLAKGAGKVGIELAQGPTTRGVGVGAKASAFAGSKAGIEVGAKVDWLKKSDYREQVFEALKRFMPEFVAKHLPLEKIAQGLIGSGGRATVIGVKAGLEGTAGIGGEIGGNFSFAGGRLKVEGKLQGTVGLGLGESIRAEIDAVEGMRLLGLIIRNAPAIAREVGIGADRVWEWFKKEVKKLYHTLRD